MFDRCDVVLVPGEQPTKVDILRLVRGVDAILWCCKVPLDADIINAAGTGTQLAMHC